MAKKPDFFIPTDLAKTKRSGPLGFGEYLSALLRPSEGDTGTNPPYRKAGEFGEEQAPSFLPPMKKSKPRDNYVEKGETPVNIFKAMAPTETTEEATAAPAPKPKMSFLPSENMALGEIQTEGQKIEAAKRSPTSSGTNFDMQTLLAGLTPLAIGVLSGETGDSYEASLKGMEISENMRARQESKDLALAKMQSDMMQSQSEAAGKGLAEYVDPATGKIRFATKADAARFGLEAQPRRRSLEDEAILADVRQAAVAKYGGRKVITKGPGGVPMVYDKASDSRTPLYKIPEGRLTPNTKKLVVKRQGEFAKHAVKMDGYITELKAALEGMGKGNLGKKLGVMKLVKAIEGRLSDQDRNFYLYPTNLLKMIGIKLEKIEDQEIIPDSTINEAKNLLIDAIDKAEKARIRTRKTYSSQLAKVSRGELTPEKAADYLDPTFKRSNIKEKASEIKSIEQSLQGSSLEDLKQMREALGE